MNYSTTVRNIGKLNGMTISRTHSDPARRSVPVINTRKFPFLIFGNNLYKAVFALADCINSTFHFSVFRIFGIWFAILHIDSERFEMTSPRLYRALPRKKQKPPGPQSGAGGGAVPCAVLRRIVVYLTMMSSFFIASSRRPASYRKSNTV